MVATPGADVAGTSTERRRWRLFGPQPISLVLFVLIVITLVPALLFSVLLLRRNDDAQQGVLITLAETTASSVSQAVDRELLSMSTTLKVLSSATSLAAGNLQDFYLRSRIAMDGTGTYVILLDRDLNQIFNTRVPFGTPLGPTSDPDSARAALSSGAPVISNVFYGRTAENWVFNVVYPLFPSQNSSASVLISTQDASRLGETLGQQTLRGGWNVTLIDQRNLVVASTDDATRTGTPFLIDSSTQSGSRRVRAEQNGQRYYTSTRSSEFSGWRVVVWAPSSSVEAPLRDSMLSLLLGGALVVALGGLGAVIIGRQIAKPVRRLARDAERLGAGEAISAEEYPISEIATVSKALADASQSRTRAENDIRLLMREVAHRSKNQLTVVASLAKQSARSARSFEAFHDSFQKRIHGLARSTDLLIAGGAAGVELRALLTAHLEPFAPAMPDRVSMRGLPFTLSNHAAQTIGLAAHEMATNAAKYGAFSVPGGRLDIEWRRDGDDLVLEWKETAYGLPERQQVPGFGTEVIERMLKGTLDARIERVLEPQGMRYRFTIPVARVEPERIPVAPDQPFE